MKEYWHKFKEFRKDPKKKSISLIIIYGLFFIFVYFYIKSNTTIDYNTSNQNISQTINEVTSYEYNYEIIKNNNIFKTKGIFYNNENKIELNNNYEIKDNNIYVADDFVIKIDTLNNKLNYNNIKSFISNYEYDSKTEYKDNTIKYTYTISNKDIKEFLAEDTINEENSTITIYEKNYIFKVEFDLSKFYNQDNYLINIEFNNVNNISNIESKEDINK